MSASGSTSQSRPFRILGLQQVAIAHRHKAPLRALWIDLLGLEPQGAFRSVHENVDEDILRLGEGPSSIELDLMVPIDPNKAPRVDRPPLHHIGLWVDDLAAAVSWLTERGVRFTKGGIRPGAHGHDVCFIHPQGSEAFPRGGEGVLIELIQAPRELRQMP